MAAVVEIGNLLAVAGVVLSPFVVVDFGAVSVVACTGTAVVLLAVVGIAAVPAVTFAETVVAFVDYSKASENESLPEMEPVYLFPTYFELFFLFLY